MSQIVKISDFVGRRSIVKNSFTSDEYQDFVDYYETIYLTELLGAELTVLFLADLTAGVPTTPIYLAIFNPFTKDEGSCLITSDGIKSMLIDFIYFEITRKSDALRTLAGNTSNISDNSERVTQNATGLFLFYNSGVRANASIQWFICENSTDYPTYNGQPKKLTSWL